MTTEQREWSDSQLMQLMEVVSDSLGEDISTPQGCAKTKTWVYAILGQAVYGRTIRGLMNNQDSCSLNHAYEMVKVFEKLSQDQEDRN